MPNTRRLTTLSLLTAVALIMFIIESQLPPLTAIPGIKLGLSNVITLVTMYLLGPGSALLVLLIRVVLGGIVTGQVGAIAYSFAGGVLSFLVLLLLRRVISLRQLWVISIFCAIAHNFGQILVAVWMTETLELFWYGFILTISGIVTGLFTGLAAQAVLMHLAKAAPDRFHFEK